MRFRTINSAPFAALFLVLIPLALICTGPSTGLPIYFAELPENCGDGSVFVVQIFQDGSLKFRTEAVTTADLEGRIREAFLTRAYRQLIIDADPDVPFQRVAEIIDIGYSQADHVALITPSLEKELQQRPFCCCLAIKYPGE